MLDAMPMDEDEQFECDKCQKLINDWNDLVTISVLDEESGEETEEETLCYSCANPS
jgi:hypothetical protein